jgi:hypothetical protein
MKKILDCCVLLAVVCLFWKAWDASIVKPEPPPVTVKVDMSQAYEVWSARTPDYPKGK